jgi:hypothetical protein
VVTPTLPASRRLTTNVTKRTYMGTGRG